MMLYSSPEFSEANKLKTEINLNATGIFKKIMPLKSKR